MRALLLAEPPAGDKVERELARLGVEVDYRRGAKAAGMVALADKPGYDWVLAMNANGLGAGLKMAAKRNGARFASIPPGWSQVERVLRENHFFSELGAAKRKTAVLSTIGDAIVAKHALEAVKAEAKSVSVAFTPAPPDAPAKVKAALEVPLSEESRDALHRAGTELMVYGTAAVHVGPEGIRQATPAEVAAAAKEESPVMKLARETFRRNPNLTGRAFLEYARGLGHSCGDHTTVYAIRREERAAQGLDPHGGIRRPRTKVEPPPAPAPVTQPAPAAEAIVAPAEQGDGDLPRDVLAAAELLAQAIRTAGLEGEVTVTHIGDVSYDVARRVEKQGRVKVDAGGGAR